MITDKLNWKEWAKKASKADLIKEIEIEEEIINHLKENADKSYIRGWTERQPYIDRLEKLVEDEIAVHEKWLAEGKLSDNGRAMKWNAEARNILEKKS
jgi:hypothetical protein